MPLIPILSLLGYALAARRMTRLPLELLPLAAASCITLMLFAAALGGLLRPVQFLLMWLGVAALAFEAFRSRHDLRAGLAPLARPGPVLFIVAALVLSFIVRGLMHVSWDEFSHWGIVPRMMLRYDRLISDPAIVTFATYPPGAALFQYFVARTLGGAEGHLIFGQGLLQLAALLTLFTGMRFERPRRVPRLNETVRLVALVVLCFFGLYCFWFPTVGVWTTVTVDLLLPLLCGAALVGYFLAGASPTALLCTVPTLALLPLVKSSGQLLAAVAVGVIAVDQAVRWVARKESDRGWPWGILAVAAAVLAIAVPALVWGWHVRALGAVDVLNTSWDAIRARMAAPDFGRNSAVTVGRFAGALTGAADFGKGPERVLVGYMPRFTLVQWGAVVTVLAAAALALQPRFVDRARLIAASGVLAAGFVVYLGSLLFYYVVAFSVFEAQQLASFGRYVGTYLLASVLVVVAFILLPRDGRSRRLATGLLVIMAVASILAVQRRSLIRAPMDSWDRSRLEIRRGVQAALRGVNDAVPDASAVYSVWNGSDGFEHYIAAFEMKPRRSNFGCFSLGPPRKEGDIWSCDHAPEALARELAAYDFLVLGRADDVFWNRYRSLFAEGAETSGARLFRIDKADGGVRLTPVPLPG